MISSSTKSIPPDRMNSAERICEACRISSLGIVRLKQRETKQITSETSQIVTSLNDETEQSWDIKNKQENIDV